MKYFREMSKESNPEKFIPFFLPLLYESGEPYFNWLFGGKEEALIRLEKLISWPSSEYYIKLITILFDDNKPIGQIYGMSGVELMRRQKADTLATFKETSRTERSDLISRMKKLQNLFTIVKEDDYYLRTSGIIPEYRGKGLARMLYNHVIENGYALGYHKFVGDCDSANAPVIKILKSFGFQVQNVSNDPISGREMLSWLLEKD